jgi:hypothetical protein
MWNEWINFDSQEYSTDPRTLRREKEKEEDHEKMERPVSGDY